MWDWEKLPIEKYNNWWSPPKGPAWWLSRIGQLHSLQLPLYLIEPTRGFRTDFSKAQSNAGTNSTAKTSP